jgi:hypothetical protein
MDILGVELRRSAAFVTALVMTLVGVGALYLAVGRWSDGWMSLALVEREYTVLLWPLALAAGAWQGRRERRTGVGELFDSTALPRTRRMMPVLGVMALAVTLAYLVTTVAGVAWIVDTAHYRPWGTFLLVTAVGVLSLVAAAWIGLAVGRALPALATAPALAVVGVLVLQLGNVLIRPYWLASLLIPIHGAGQASPYQTVPDRISAAQAIWLGALACAGAILLTARKRRTGAAVLPLVLGLAIGAAVIPHRDRDSFDVPMDPAARELVCAEGGPKVCVSRVNSNVLAELTPLARQGLALLAKLPDPPTAVHENTSHTLAEVIAMPRADVVHIEIRVDKYGKLGHPGLVVYDVVRHLGIKFDSECEHRNAAVERAAVYWLLGREPRSDVGLVPGMISEPAEDTADAITLWRGLQAVPESEALARVTAVQQARRQCEPVDDLLSRSAR